MSREVSSDEKGGGGAGVVEAVAWLLPAVTVDVPVSPAAGV